MNTLAKFCDVMSTCISCSSRRPYGIRFASLTVYTILSNWSHAGETNYTTNQSEVIPFHLYKINLLLPNVCNLYIKKFWNLTTRLWRLSMPNSVMALLASYVALQATGCLIPTILFIQIYPQDLNTIDKLKFHKVSSI